MSTNPFETPKAPLEVPDEGPVGLGGALALLGFVLVVSAVKLGLYVVKTFPPIFSNGTWETLTTPGPAPYHPLWGTVLIFEAVGNCAFVLGALFLLVFFFRKSARFPKFCIAYLIGNLAFVVADAFLASTVLTGEPVFDPETVRELAASLIASMIWIPYLLRSKRVRNTFRARVN